MQKVPPKSEEAKVIVEGKASDVANVIKEIEPMTDVAATAKFNHQTNQILKHREGVSQLNKREGLRERKPQSQLEHSEFGRINWN